MVSIPFAVVTFRVVFATNVVLESYLKAAGASMFSFQYRSAYRAFLVNLTRVAMMFSDSLAKNTANRSLVPASYDPSTEVPGFTFGFSFEFSDEIVEFLNFCVSVEDFSIYLAPALPNHGLVLFSIVHCDIFYKFGILLDNLRFLRGVRPWLKHLSALPLAAAIVSSSVYGVFRGCRWGRFPNGVGNCVAHAVYARSDEFLKFRRLVLNNRFQILETVLAVAWKNALESNFQ
ncbi:unnamed protein product [Haemonchus placei]|uniref:Secreted protein n=1 Tax=Haemonchus placei TaxID=6290 RepID=A0A0N4WUE2_HAEPC|nr:unnamed protein product [Haemonchus placei]